jgi:ATP-dependent Clp protease ATP-binding subunit ClpX
MKKNTIGFNLEKQDSEIEKKDVFHKVHTEDLIHYGLIPELVGRLPVIGILDELDQNQLYRILIEPKNAITKQFKYLFELDGVEIEFSQDVLKRIAREAINREVGARGLRAIFEELMMDLMFEIPSKKEKMDKIVIDFEFLKGKKWIA